MKQKHEFIGKASHRAKFDPDYNPNCEPQTGNIYNIEIGYHEEIINVYVELPEHHAWQKRYNIDKFNLDWKKIDHLKHKEQ